MKKTALHFLIVSLLALLSLHTNAHDLEVNGIYYDFIPNTESVKVTHGKESYHQDQVTIPATIMYQETVYQVTAIGDSAFRKCTKLTSVVLPNSITSIGKSAFAGCTQFTSITIPDEVTTIGSSAFAGCSSLATIEIPSKVTTIKNNTFHNCRTLKSVTFKDGLKSIGQKAFEGCRNLTSIELPKSVTSIGELAFHECDLQEMKVDSENSKFDSRDECNAIIQKEGNILFLGCKNTTFPESVKKIGSSAFYDCEGMTSVTIPGNITEIGEKAFQNCTNLKSVTYEDGLENIGHVAFEGCRNLTSIEIPQSVRSIANNAFYRCNLEKIVVVPENPVFNSKDDCNAIIQTRTGALLIGCKNTTIPNDIKAIGEDAFRGCQELTDITLPDNVTAIGSFAFYDCKNLQSITLPDQLYSIGEYAFAKCTKLASIDLPNSVREIGYDAFSDCSSLQSVTIPYGVTTIERFLFNNCTHLTSCTIPNSVTTIESYAFEGCTKLTSCTIPNSVQFIGLKAFYGCKGLTSVHITDLSAWCNISFNYPENNPLTYAHCLYLNDEEVKDLVIPDDVTSIGTGAFWGCDSLTSVMVPEGVTTIRSNAFRKCKKITSVTLPRSLAYIGERGVFAYCDTLSDVYCYATEVPKGLGDASSSDRVGIFEGLKKEKATLHVPASAINAYKSTAPWNTFGHIMALPEITPMEKEKEVTFDKGITEKTDLTSAVIDNIYVSLDTDTGNDNYDVQEKCIVLASTVTDDQLTAIADKEVHNMEVKANYNGLILEVPTGKGTINITAQTKGTHTLSVKVGNNKAQAYTKSERGVIQVPFTTEKDTYVYIYGTETASVNAQRRSATSGDVKNGVLIYSIKWEQDGTTNIGTVTPTEGTYSIYTPDGRPTPTLQKGVNIIRYSNEQTKKVIVK